MSAYILSAKVLHRRFFLLPAFFIIDASAVDLQFLNLNSLVVVFFPACFFSLKSFICLMFHRRLRFRLMFYSS